MNKKNYADFPCYSKKDTADSNYEFVKLTATFKGTNCKTIYIINLQSSTLLKALKIHHLTLTKKLKTNS
jgi:hypothetical protein